MKTAKRIISVFLILSLLAAAGCANPSWVYSAYGIQVSPGAYISFILEAIGELEDADREAYGENVYNQYEPPPLAQFLKLTGSGGLTYSQMAVSRAAALSREFIAVELLFAEKGLSFSDTDERNISNSAASNYISGREFFDRNGVGEASVKAVHANKLKKDRLFAHMYSEGGERGISEAELISAFEERYARVEIMFMRVADWDGDEDAQEMAFAQEYLERYKNGEPLADILYDYETRMAGDDGEEVVKTAPEQLIMLADMKAGTDDSELIKAVRAAAVGEPGSLEAEGGNFYIFQKLPLMDDESLFPSIRPQLLFDLAGDEFEEYVTGYANTLNIEANAQAISRYTPERIWTNR
ncbi:MAG: hypothetical protein FWH02_08400 [Oscillospiraceae bacterium]|nr:hypothetical protein [Oscillospiraceae bacterium]